MLSDRLVSLRKAKDKTQLEVADYLGITRPAYTAYESGNRRPDYSILEKLARYFRVTTDYLISGKIDFTVVGIPDWLWNFELPRGVEVYFEDKPLGYTGTSMTLNELHKQFTNKVPYYSWINTYVYEDQFNKISLYVTFQLAFPELGPDFLGQKDIFVAETSSVLESSQQLTIPEDVLERSKRFIQEQINKMRPQESSVVGESAAQNNDSIVRIPILGTIKAGYNLYAEQQVIGYSLIDRESVAEGEYFFLKVKGDSMTGDRINEGDRVLVRRQDLVEEGKIAVVLVNEDEATLRRIYPQGDMAILQASNPSHPPKIYPVDEVRIQGQVIKVEFDL